jgi:type IV pilus assembly protein PilE
MRHSLTIVRGFTLVELMCVVVIVAVLVTIALPAYRGHLISAKRISGKTILMSVLARQEQYLINNQRYAVSLDLLGYDSSPFAIGPTGNRVAINSPERTYLLSISGVSPPEAPMAFTLQAIPQLGQTEDSRCGILALSSTGVKSASAGSLAQCW